MYPFIVAATFPPDDSCPADLSVAHQLLNVNVLDGYRIELIDRSGS